MAFGKLGARGGFGSLGGLGSAGVRFTGAPFALTSAQPLADGQCWFHEPRALASGGKLWFGTNGSNDNTQTTGRASLYEVTEANGSIIRKDLATGAFWGDDHNYPVVMIRPDGRLVVFYCAHRQNDPIRFRISVSVGTMVGGWSQEYTIPNTQVTNPTYPTPAMLSAESNKVYLFFRDGIAASLAYMTSTDLATVGAASVDGGALGATPTWSAKNTVTTASGAQGIYAKIRGNGVDRIDLLITDAQSGTTGPKVDVRHGYYTAGTWNTSAGVSLGSLPITFSTFTAVATSGAPDSFGDVWVWDIQNRGSSVIEALFVRFAAVSDHRYYYARWNGSAWSKTEIDAGLGSGVPDTRSSQITDGNGAAEGYYSPGLYLDSALAGVVYCSIGYSTYSLVYRYQTANAGSSWTRARVSGAVKENVRPFVPQGRTSLYSVLWASGDYHYYDFAGTSDFSYGYTTRINAASLAYSASGVAPSNSSVPTVAGTALVGNTLTSTNGTWSGDLPIAYTYQWLRDGSNIASATSSSYTVVSADVGHSITLQVTGTNSFGNAAAVSAAATGLPVNLLVHSEAIDLWNGSGTVGNIVTTNVANEPINGQLTADRLTEGILGSLSSHNNNCVAISFANATAYTFSVCAKYESRQYLQLLFGAGAFGSNAYANFDIQNGTVQTVGASSTASIVSLGNGWYRLIMTATSTAAASTVAGVYGIDASNAARGENYVAGTAHSWLLADGQVETGSNANNYAPTA